MDGRDRLEILRVPRGDGSELRLAGDLTLATATALVEELRVLERSSPELLVLDLRQVRFVDSTGLAELIAAQKRRRDGRRLVLVIDPGPVERLLALSGLLGRFEIAPRPPDGAAA
jgi:stage II sporulation protein AA (anti-sigma F factor antagonist)